jgi:hypothetical protein
MRRFAASLVPVLFAAVANHAAAQSVPGQLPQDVQVQQQVLNIVRDHPSSAAYEARAFLHIIAPEEELRDDPAYGPGYPTLDRLKDADVDAYWREVAQLAVQFDILQTVMRRDSTRARYMAGMFKTEYFARTIQRAWRGSTDAQRTTLRSQLETVMSQHFDLEEQLRSLEMQDIQRRLADAQADFQRRQQRKTELVRWSVDDIIHGAERPD